MVSKENSKKIENLATISAMAESANEITEEMVRKSKKPTIIIGGPKLANRDSKEYKCSICKKSAFVCDDFSKNLLRKKLAKIWCAECFMTQKTKRIMELSIAKSTKEEVRTLVKGEVEKIADEEAERIRDPSIGRAS